MRYTKGAATRQAVLEAAIRRFGRDGYRAASVVDIARDAGVGGTAAYSYFPNKEALFLAAVDQDAHGVIEEMFGGVTEEVYLASFARHLLAAAIAAVARHPLAERLLSGQEPEVRARVIGTPAVAEVQKMIAARLRDGQEIGKVRGDIDADDAAKGLVGIFLSLLASVVQLGGPIHAYEDAIIKVLHASVAPEPKA